MTISFARTKNYEAQPPFLVDRDQVVRDTGRQIAWEYLGSKYQAGAVAVSVNGAVTAADTTVTVDALADDIRSGSLINFGGGNIIEVTADADAGATSLSIKAAAKAIADNAVGYVDNEPIVTGRHVKAGTVMALLADGRMVPRADRPGSETAFALMATNADEDSRTDAATGYGVIKSAAVYENLLPEAAGSPKVISSTYKTELLAAGGFWMFEQYSDNT